MMRSSVLRQESSVEKEATIAALKAIAEGNKIDEGYEPHEHKPKASPLARTQRIRISGRTIRSGLE
ncbi:MAG: hypothetical protein GC164_05870 [Phycisphaera sp.]|nr:hypothetical protein [Phycisphaera sp.]